MSEAEKKYAALVTSLTMLHAKWIDQANALEDPRRGEHAGIHHCANGLWDLLTSSKETVS